jgi:hypothetical protein
LELPRRLVLVVRGLARELEMPALVLEQRGRLDEERRWRRRQRHGWPNSLAWLVQLELEPPLERLQREVL